MYSVRINAAFAAFMAVFFAASPLLIPFPASAQTANNSVCNSVFALPPGTTHMSSPNGNRVMNAQVCTAYNELIPRYQIGSRSAPCIRTKAEGITGLNPEFAVALNRMLKEMPGGSGLSIVSALRPRQCQGSTNPESNHVYGCAVDLGYSQNDCSSAQCQWIRANAGRYGLQIRMQYAPEWNHIEPINVQACRRNQPNSTPQQPGTTPQTTPESPAPTISGNPDTERSTPQTTPIPSTAQPNPTGLSGFPTGVPMTPTPSSPNTASYGSPMPSTGSNGTPSTASYSSPSTASYGASTASYSSPSTASYGSVTGSYSNPSTASYMYPTTASYAGYTLSGTSTLAGDSVDPFSRLLILGANQPNRSTVIPGVTTPQPEELSDDLYDIGNTGVPVNTGGRNNTDPLYEPEGTFAYQQGSSLDNPRPDRISATETFSGTSNSRNDEPQTQRPTIAAPRYDSSVIGTLLVVLRDFLVLFRDAMVNQRTFGFNGPWRPAGYNEHAAE